MGRSFGRMERVRACYHAVLTLTLTDRLLLYLSVLKPVKVTDYMRIAPPYTSSHQVMDKQKEIK